MQWNVLGTISARCGRAAPTASRIALAAVTFGIPDEELGPDMTGAGGKGNMVVEILEVRGETDSDECDEVLSDGVKLATFLGLISALISLLALLTCPLV